MRGGCAVRNRLGRGNSRQVAGNRANTRQINGFKGETGCQSFADGRDRSSDGGLAKRRCLGFAHIADVP